jgi:hypothetical protein
VKFKIRELRRDDERAYADLCAARPKLARADAEQRARLVQFLAFENPTSDGEPTYFVVESGDRLMGHMGRMPTWFWVGGRRHLATFAHDLFVHPEMQASGQGFFATMRLYQAVEKASKSFIAMCWTNDINIRLQQTRHYSQMWVERHVRPMRVDGKLGPLHRVAVIEQAATTVGNLVFRGFDRALSVVGGHRRLVDVVDPDARFDDLAERVGPTMGIAPVKDAAYLRYKYVARPGLATKIIGAESAPGNLVGFIVLREVTGLRKTGTILDFCANPDDAATCEALLSAALRFYAQRQVGSIEAVVAGPGIGNALARVGFVRRGDKLPLFFTNGVQSGKLPLISDVQNWHHVYGDSEGPY